MPFLESYRVLHDTYKINDLQILLRCNNELYLIFCGEIITAIMVI